MVAPALAQPIAAGRYQITDRLAKIINRIQLVFWGTNKSPQIVQLVSILRETTINLNNIAQLVFYESRKRPQKAQMGYIYNVMLRRHIFFAPKTSAKASILGILQEKLCPPWRFRVTDFLLNFYYNGSIWLHHKQNSS